MHFEVNPCFVTHPYKSKKIQVFVYKVQSSKTVNGEGAWVAQSVEHLTLGFGLVHDLEVHELEPRVPLCADSAEPAWVLSLPPSLSLPLPHSCSLSRALSK